MRTRSRIFFAFFMAASAVAVFPQETKAGGAGSLVIFPYFSPGSSLPDRYSFLLFTVPDVVRLALLAENRFALVERPEWEALAGDRAPDWAADEAACLEVARRAKADYFVRGYLSGVDGSLRLLHSLVDAKTGRTVHMDERTLPIGPELIDLVEASAGDFSGWVNRELPDRVPETVIVEKEQVVYRDRTALSLDIGFDEAMYLPFMDQYLSPSPSLRMGIRASKAARPDFSLGALLKVYLLEQKQSFFAQSGQQIDVLFVPFYLSASWRLLSAGWVAIDASILAGPSAIFGFVEPRIISYFRPSAGVDLSLAIFPLSRVSLVVGCELSWTPYIYGSMQMFVVAPGATLRLGL